MHIPPGGEWSSGPLSHRPPPAPPPAHRDVPAAAPPPAPWPPPDEPWLPPHEGPERTPAFDAPLWHPAPRRRTGRAVWASSLLAGLVALAALAACVLLVVEAAQDPPARGQDLSAHYSDQLHQRPAPVRTDVRDHPFYEVAMPEPVACDLPVLDPDSDTSWQEFAHASGGCLDELWRPRLAELGLRADPPEFALTSQAPDEGSEDGSTLAYYQSHDTTITLVLPNVRELAAFVPADQQESVWLALMGHEYAHHLQQVTGILRSSHEMRRDAPDEEGELEALRRTELQAECLSGAGLRGLTSHGDAALAHVNAHFNGAGDLNTHGSARNRAFWLHQGWAQSTVGACNTYTADTQSVR